MHDAQLAECVRTVCAREWSGPDRSPKVEAMLLKERTVSMKKRQFRHPLAFIIAATVTSGALAAVITDRVLSRRAILTTEDGETFEVELVEAPAGGASGTYITEDGTTYEVNLDDGDRDRAITVDVHGPTPPEELSVTVSDDPLTALSRRRAPERDADGDSTGADR